MNKKFSVLTVSKRTGWKDAAEACIARQTVKPYHWDIIFEGINAPVQTRASNLNASLNAGLRLIDTAYVIFYQDFIDLPDDCFEKLLNCVDARTFVTTATINADGSNDARYTGSDTVHRIRPEFWEANVAIAPMDIVRALGGFEENLDDGWAYDNVHLAQRAAMLGCKFLIDETNRPQLLEHEQTSKLKLELNDHRCATDIAQIRAGKKPLRLPYLD